LACHPRSKVARLSAVASVATASAVHILLRNYVIQNQNIAQLCTVLQRLRQRVKRTFYLGNRQVAPQPHTAFKAACGVVLFCSPASL
jgi:hypothetical protein